jgi:hypothetical protein
VRTVADVGLALLPGLGVETLTGGILFVFAHGLSPKESILANQLFAALASANLIFLQDITFQTDVHVWLGYVTCGVVGLKAWASWPTLLGWRPKRFSPTRHHVEKVLAWSLLALVVACYLTGLALTVRSYLSPVIAWRLVRDAHLWTSALLLVPLSWHLWRFLGVAVRVVTVQLRGSRPALRRGEAGRAVRLV